MKKRITRRGFAACALLAGTTAHASAETPDFRIGVTLVKAETYVYDKQTKAPVHGLSAEDFIVFDGEEQRPVEHFANETGPLDLLLLLDVSGSMRDLLPAVAVETDKALRTLQDRDRAAVMAFGSRCTLTQPLTNDFDLATKGILRSLVARVGMDTDISLALRGSAQYLGESGGTSKRAILILTDNMQVTSVPDTEVERALFDADAVLDAVLIRGLLPVPHVLHPGVLRFVPKTGGETIEGRHPERLMGEMIGRIRARYSIHFRPAQAKSSGARRIRIELSPEARAQHPNAAVRARERYYPEGPARVRCSGRDCS